MHALYFDGYELVHRSDLPPPESQGEEALIRVHLAGICGTDLAICRGYKGFQGILGHEFVGTVEEAPESDWVGRRVVGEINLGCGYCDWCRRGIPNHCPQRRALGIHGRSGAFAEYLTLPIRNLHLVPNEVSDRRAVFTEPLAAALQILEQTHIQPQQRVYVIGDGRLGLLIAQVMHLSGAHVTAIGRHVRKLALLTAHGIETCLSAEPPQAQADVVVEATGSPDGFQAALELVRPRGVLVLKSTFGEQISADLSHVVVNEVQIVGSRCGPFEPALRLLREGRVEVESLIDTVYPLNKGVSAFEHAQSKGTIKILLQIAA